MLPRSLSTSAKAVRASLQRKREAYLLVSSFLLLIRRKLPSTRLLSRKIPRRGTFPPLPRKRRLKHLLLRKW